MFRRITILAAALLSACATQTRMPPLVVESTYEAPGRTGRQLCGAARDWAALTFNDSKAVVEVYEPERGRMIGKGTFTIIGFAGVPFYVDFTFVIDCKEGQFGSRFQNYQVRGNGPGVYPLKEDSRNQIYSRARSRTKSLAEKLRIAVIDDTAPSTTVDK